MQSTRTLITEEQIEAASQNVESEFGSVDELGWFGLCWYSASADEVIESPELVDTHYFIIKIDQQGFKEAVSGWLKHDEAQTMFEAFEKMIAKKWEDHLADELDDEVIALAKHLDISLDEASLHCDHMGNGFIEYRKECYYVLNDEDADERARDVIQEQVWAFNADFLCMYMAGDLTAEMVNDMRGNQCEAVNDAFVALIEAGSGMEEFTTDAFGADGRGHFLNSYDGEEYEEEVNGTTYYIYQS